MKQKLRDELEVLAQLEQANRTDNFNQIVAIVTKFRDKYGVDKDLNKFISNYLVARHERLYYKNIRVKNG